MIDLRQNADLRQWTGLPDAEWVGGGRGRVDMTQDAELAALASDFDHVSLTFRDRRLEFYAYLAEHREPVRWSSKHGGFWFVSTYDEALAAQRMPEAFSNKDFTIPSTRATSACSAPTSPP
jgi:hypothetical protein